MGLRLPNSYTVSQIYEIKAAKKIIQFSLFSSSVKIESPINQAERHPDYRCTVIRMLCPIGGEKEIFVVFIKS